MNRRAFLQSVIVGTLAAPFVTRRQKKIILELTSEWIFDTSVYRTHPKQREFFESRAPSVLYRARRPMIAWKDPQSGQYSTNPIIPKRAWVEF